MKVVCIKKEGNDWVTGFLNIGDTYEVLESVYGSDQKARRGSSKEDLKDTLFFNSRHINYELYGIWIQGEFKSGFIINLNRKIIYFGTVEEYNTNNTEMPQVSYNKDSEKRKKIKDHITNSKSEFTKEESEELEESDESNELEELEENVLGELAIIIPVMKETRVYNHTSALEPNKF